MTTDTMPTDNACWAALDRCEAAFAGDDVHEQMAAIEAALDLWLDAGHITTEDIRTAMIGPAPGGQRSTLDEAMRVLIELDPELAGEQVDIALRKMDGAEGLDDAGWGALVVNAYVVARQDMGLDVRLTPEMREALVRASRSIETRTDLACLLLWRHAHKEWSPEQGDHAEAWSTAKGARRDARGILSLLGEPIDSTEAWYLQRQTTQDGDE